MPLSDHEQRILDEIERRLVAEDPKFARTTAVATPRGVAVRRVKRAAYGFGVGLLLLLVGLLAGLGGADWLLAFGLLGFAVMLASVVAFARASKDIGGLSGGGADALKWFGKAEEHWRKRFERGDGR